MKVKKVETTNLTSLLLCLVVVGIRTREITVQVRDRNLHTTNRSNVVILFSRSPVFAYLEDLALSLTFFFLNNEMCNSRVTKPIKNKNSEYLSTSIQILDTIYLLFFDKLFLDKQVFNKICLCPL